MEYKEAQRRDFDAVATTDGVIYHQRGGYEVIDGNDIFIPVNRSYRPVEGSDFDINRNGWLSRDNYTNHDRIISDSVDDEAQLRRNEHILSVYGKRSFCLNINESNVCREFSTDSTHNSQLSKESTQLVGRLRETMNDSEILSDIGVYGSHQMGINKDESDLDLVAWSSRETRQDTVTHIGHALEKMGYIPVHDRPELLTKYALRYAKRMGLSIEGGYALAAERLRWISPEGVSTSLQCLHSDYDHSWAGEVFNGGLGDIETSEDVRMNSVRVFEKAEPYNFPRLWKISVDDSEIADAISLDWAHQGMGADEADVYCMQARKVTTSLGRTAYILTAQSDFILPERMVR